MDTADIIRAWKDEEFRRSLAPDQLARLPLTPAGAIELSDADLGDVAGGARTVGNACTIVTQFCSNNCSSYGNCE